MPITLQVPDWVEQLNSERPRFSSPREIMRLCIDASERNSREGGGPFAAAVVEDDEQLIALGVNLVMPASSSILHGEMVALLLAQRRLETPVLDPQRHTLVTSCAPCVMCWGALPLSGIGGLVCGAATADAERAGFDEGDKPGDWRRLLEQRGIAVTEDVERPAARDVLLAYARAGGVIYTGPASR